MSIIKGLSDEKAYLLTQYIIGERERDNTVCEFCGVSVAGGEIHYNDCPDNEDAPFGNRF